MTENLPFDKVQISIPCFPSNIQVCKTLQVLLRIEIENYIIQINNIILVMTPNLNRVRNNGNFILVLDCNSSFLVPLQVFGNLCRPQAPWGNLTKSL